MVTGGVATGRVLQFDQSRGFGFVAADDGGEDVFLHASVFDGDPDDLVPGTKMEFKVMAGDRGRKAFAAHLIDDELDRDLIGPPRPASPSRPVPGLPPWPGSPSGPATAPPAQPATVAVASAPPAGQAPDDESMCDVLSSAELLQELTELLLSTSPSLTGQQLLEVRQGVLASARKHGWVDL